MWVVQRELVESVNPIFGAVLVTLPFIALNEYILADREMWLQYYRRFQQWSAIKRHVADTFAALFVLLAVVAPLIIRSFYTRIPWWR